MRTDAMIFSLSSGNEMRKGRMDRVSESRDDSTAQGFGRSDQAERKGISRFMETYEQVARTNARAQKATDKRSEVVQRHDRSDRGPQACADSENDVTQTERNRPDQTSPVEDIEAGEELKEDCVEQAPRHQAVVIIREALTEISQALQMKVDSGLGDLSLETISDETIEQFAEILHALTNIASMLEGAIAEGAPVDLGGRVLNVENMTEMGQVVRTRQFRIEIALGMLGVSEQTAASVAAKSQQSLVSGIIQASNPSELSMPQSQVQQVFGNVLASPQTEVANLARKMMELVKESGADAQFSMTLRVTTRQTVQQSGLTQLDSQTMRGILRIDLPQDAIVEQNNNAAASNQKLDLPGVTGQLFAKNLSDLGKNIVQESVPPTEVFTLPKDNVLTEGVVKTPSTLSKALDAPVMTQITEKFQTAVRSGVNEVRIQLRPEALGEVRLRIRVEGDVVIARIQVESQQVKQIVETGLQNLRDSLAHQNLQAGAFEVNVGQGWNDETNQAWKDAQPGSGNSADHGHDSGNDEAGAAAPSDSVVLGKDTGRRFGSNSMEYFV